MSCLPVKISVIVPVYNVEQYLSTCLNSCIHQTLYDIEIICVNDGSTDNSLAILQEFAKKDSRVVIVDKANGGLSSARNAGVRKACGKKIMFLDSDDYLEPNACERVWLETLEGDADVVVFGTNIFPLDPEPNQWLYDTLNIYTHRYWGFTPEVLFDEPGAKPFVWRQAYDRKFFTKFGLSFDENVKFGEDMVFQMEAFPHGWSFAFISDKLYNYRWYRQGSLMNSVSTDMNDKLTKHMYFVEVISDYWKRHGWIERYGSDYTRWLLEFLMPDIDTLKRDDANKQITVLKQLIQKYGLAIYLDEMPEDLRGYANTLKRQTV